MRTRKLKALTLVEVVTYLALFGFIFITIIQFVISVKQSNDYAIYKSDLERASIFFMNHMNNSFNKSNNIRTDNSLFDIDQGKISLDTIDGVFEYVLVNDQVRFINPIGTYDITTDKFAVSTMRFEKIINSDNEVLGVRVNFTISSSKNPNLTRSLVTSFLVR